MQRAIPRRRTGRRWIERGYAVLAERRGEMKYRMSQLLEPYRCDMYAVSKRAWSPVAALLLSGPKTLHIHYIREKRRRRYPCAARKSICTQADDPFEISHRCHHGRPLAHPGGIGLLRSADDFVRGASYTSAELRRDLSCKFAMPEGDERTADTDIRSDQLVPLARKLLYSPGSRFNR